ncbi:MAG: hypothetical protein N3F06_05060, partial [Nitrososphaerales archaeon]|nr:hypothetical protein [Nitrososphaerales archaeon]
MSTISSFIFRLLVEQPVTFQSFSGFAACGIFYNLVRSIDESFAESLHSSKKLAPWSSTPFLIEFPPPSKIVYRTLPAPSLVNVSFSIVDEKLSEIFKEAILKPELYVDLIDVKTKVVGVSVNTYRFSDLLLNAEPLPERFAVKFLTPTSFRRSIYDCCPDCPHYINYTHMVREGQRMGGPCEYAVRCRGVNVPLPIPSLMFRNLVRLWSAFSDAHLDTSKVLRWVENAIVIAGYPKPGIRTVRVYE